MPSRDVGKSPSLQGGEDVNIDGPTEIPGLRLSDERLEHLSAAGDPRITIAGGELSASLRALQIAREDLGEAERLARAARERIEKLQSTIKTLRTPALPPDDPAP